MTHEIDEVFNIMLKIRAMTEHFYEGEIRTLS